MDGHFTNIFKDFNMTTYRCLIDLYRPTCLVYCLTFYMMLLMLILVRTIMHSHGDSIEYGHFWMVILVRVLTVSHFSMEAHWGLL